jgi:hypothetical protein
MNLSNLLFSAALHPYIFATPFADKMHSLFSASHQSENPFPAFFTRYNFSPFLNNAPIIHIEEFLNLPVNPVWRVPGFYGGEGLIASIATPGFNAPRP